MINRIELGGMMLVPNSFGMIVEDFRKLIGYTRKEMIDEIENLFELIRLSDRKLKAQEAKRISGRPKVKVAKEKAESEENNVIHR